MPHPAPTASSTGVSTPGWLVVDPAGHSYAWYSLEVAKDTAAVWKLIGRNAEIRRKYVADGWIVRAGSWPELFADGADLVQASA